MRDIKALVSIFCEGGYDDDIEGRYWIEAFQYFLGNYQSLEFSQEKIHLLWTEKGGHLRCKVKDDKLIADVLSRALPRYQGDAVRLYRGECKFLYEAGLIGFCWTPVIVTAEMFARGLNAKHPGGGVLLETCAAPSAIISGPSAHSVYLQEQEYTCDPARLERVQVLKYFES